ncbi:MAG: glycosyl transferase group 1 [Mucilaginibacter sp.]|nr:glycosyl transferase group 1 [Mucilaginibacter sp.]
MKRNILFISHDASMTGAPILLLNLAKVLVGNAPDKYSISFLIKQANNKQLDGFYSFKLTLASPQHATDGIIYKIYEKLRRKIKGQFYSERNIEKSLKGIDVVISNTITNGDILPIVRQFFSGPIISYIHELEMASKFFTEKNNINSLINCSDKFWVPSLAVKSFLIESLNIADDKIKGMPYYIPPFKDGISHKSENQQFLVGAVGTTDWRKSPELFIQVARYTFQADNSANIKFVWKGGSEKGIDIDRLNYDIKKCGLEGRVEFQSASIDLSEYYSNLDLFLLTSREDPYPLVVLEAASAGVPAICFNDTGGASEFIKSSGGKCVSFLDTKAMSDAVLFYYNNKEKAISDGQSAKRALSAKHQNPEYIINQFNIALDK